MAAAIQNSKASYVRSFVEHPLFDSNAVAEITRFAGLPATLFHRAVVNAAPQSVPSEKPTALTKPCYKIQVLFPIATDPLFHNVRSQALNSLYFYGHLLPDATIQSAILSLAVLNKMQNLGKMLVYLALTGRSECVDTIIQSNRFGDIDLNDLGWAFFWASDKSYVSVAQAIIQSNRFAAIDPEYLGYAFQAAHNSNVNIVQAIIKSGRLGAIDPQHLGNALQGAASKGHKDIVQAIMQSDRFKDIGSKSLGFALQAAQKNGHGPIVQLLTPFIPNPEA